MRKRPQPCLSLERARRLRVLQLVVEVFQVFLELAVRQHFLEPAPGRLAAFSLSSHPFVHAVEQAVIIRAVLGGAR